MLTGEQERLYCCVTGEVVTIKHRPSHQYIVTCEKDEAEELLDKLLSMKKGAFYKYLIKHDVRLDTSIKSGVMEQEFKEAEDWYQKAWRYTTEKLFDELDLEGVVEIVPINHIKELYAEKKRLQSEEFLERHRKEEQLREQKKQELMKKMEKGKAEQDKFTPKKGEVLLITSAGAKVGVYKIIKQTSSWLGIETSKGKMKFDKNTLKNKTGHYKVELG